MSKKIITTKDVSIHIKDKQIIKDISIDIERGKIYSIIGPNGSGKTTLLRAISRNLKPTKGRVHLNGADVFKTPTRDVARTMAVLTQSHANMNDVTVRQLISYGRFAHKSWWKGGQVEDVEIVDSCLEITGLTDLQEHRLSTLSGGESQRAWIAMALAQKPQILILDEPTTYLDISHQIEVLELVKRLNEEEGITILMVLHDINHAARYSDELIIIKEGGLYNCGEPWKMLTKEILQDVFNVEAVITKDEETDKPLFYAKRVMKRERDKL